MDNEKDENSSEHNNNENSANPVEDFEDILQTRIKAVKDLSALKHDKRKCDQAKDIIANSARKLAFLLKEYPLAVPQSTAYQLTKTYFLRFQFADDKSHQQKNLIKALKQIESAAILDDEKTFCLWGKILFSMANFQTHLREKEDTLTVAAQKFLGAIEVSPNPRKGTYESLEKCLEELTTMPKERERTGSVVYLIAGEFVKDGGSVKSWKNRWFVVDDTNIVYYKDKRNWNNGPVKGIPGEPKGSIEFTSILDVLTNDKSVPFTAPKKYEDTSSLHIVTAERTYNIVGFSKEEAEKWKLALKKAAATHNAMKNGKKWLRENKALKNEPTVDSDEEEWNQYKKSKEKL